MSSKSIKISSNSVELMEELYQQFKSERLDVDKTKVAVEGAQGFDIVLNINLDVNQILIFITFVKTCILNKQCKLFTKKDENTKEVDVKLLDENKPEEFIELIKDEKTEIYVEKEKI